MNNGIGWFEIYVANLDRAKAFYEKVFAIELQPIGNPETAELTMLAFPSNMEQYGSGGAIVHYEGCQSGGNSTVVYFSCDDCAIEEGRVVAAGGQVQQGKFSIGEFGFCSHILDSEGNLIGLHSQQ